MLHHNEQTIPEYLTTPQAAAYLSVAAKTLEALRLRGQGPVTIRIGRLVRYARKDLDAFMLAHREQEGETA